MFTFLFFFFWELSFLSSCPFLYWAVSLSLNALWRRALPLTDLKHFTTMYFDNIPPKEGKNYSPILFLLILFFSVDVRIFSAAIYTFLCGRSLLPSSSASPAAVCTATLERVAPSWGERDGWGWASKLSVFHDSALWKERLGTRRNGKHGKSVHYF